MTSRSYYDSFYRELAKIDEQYNSFAKVESVIPELPVHATVLDVGCGHGSVSECLVRKGHRVYGMEINREALDSLTTKGIIPVEQDITLPFTVVERFDLVLLLDVLEHVFDPLSLLEQAGKVLKNDGSIIVTVPLYFDLLDRLRILFTGSIISYDNSCYGKQLHRRFRSYSYDHIRFFRPSDLLEMCESLGFTVGKVHYSPIPAGSLGLPLAVVARLFSNRFTVNLAPGLLAHSMTLRIQKQLR